MKKLFWLLVMLVCPVVTQAQVAQPYITTTSPMGATRGTTVTFTVDGYNLSGAREVLWSKPGVTDCGVSRSSTAGGSRPSVMRVAAVGARQLTRMPSLAPSIESVCISPTKAIFAAP